MTRFAFALPFLLLAAACGEGGAADRAFVQAYRDNGIKACVATARTTGAAAVDEALLTRLCTCTTERTMAGRTAAELLQLAPGGPETQAAATACLREIAPEAAGRLGVPAATADAAAASAIARASDMVSGVLDRAGAAERAEPAAG